MIGIYKFHILNPGVKEMPLSALNTYLTNKEVFFYDVSENSFVQVSRDYFDDVRFYFIKEGDILKKDICKYEEFKQDRFEKFLKSLDF